MSEEPKIIDDIAEFLFGVPLYAKYKISRELLEQLYGKAQDKYGRFVPAKVDGYCCGCGKGTTFTVHGVNIGGGDPWNNIDHRNAYDQFSISCARDTLHRVYYWIELNRLIVQKVGQDPSLADISNDEVAQYRRNLTKQDGQEFHKAIGLAAHGVGVGSFVYLRRVFERLIYGRFNEFKDTEGWKIEEFNEKRMAEKVAFLKGHLPEFLVENAKIYSILSVGIHELDEETCLKNFDMLKNSVLMILEDDKKKKEELSMRAKFSKAIAAMGTSEPSEK